MPAPIPRKKCFVIMPFGEKENFDGTIIDFDEVYDYLIRPTVESIGITCVRCDKIDKAGWIHAKMFEHIYDSDVAVVDLTTLNPNVFYELGVRHALVDSVTVLLLREGTKIPFNLNGFQVIEYNLGLKSVDTAKRRMVNVIKNGLKSKENDSLVHEVLDLKIGSAPKDLSKTEIIRYSLLGADKRQICIITGDIRDIKEIDVWVNSENNNLQMARYFDRSISSVIRYCGAKKINNRVIEDTIQDELFKNYGENANLPAGDVVVTGAGELERSRGVKKIFHAAAVIGQLGKGYVPIEDIGRCVRNALEMADSEELKGDKLKSILFPLMGTGTSRGELEPKARELILAAISHMKADPKGRIQQAYFMARNEKDLEVCRRILDGNPDVILVKSPRGGTASKKSAGKSARSARR